MEESDNNMDPNTYFEIYDSDDEESLWIRPKIGIDRDVSTINFPADIRRWMNVGLTLVQRRRRWTNVKAKLILRLVSPLLGLDPFPANRKGCPSNVAMS